MDIFQLFGRIAIDNQEANKAIDETGKKAKDGEKEVSNAFKKIGSVAGTVAKGIGTAGAALGGAWIAAIEGTREYRVSMGKLETAFTTAGHSADTAKSTYSDLNAVLGDSDVAVEASNHLALLVDNEKDMKTWTDICTGAFATFGSSLPTESITESSLEVAKNGQLTGGLVDALVWAGKSEEEFQAALDECTTEQERQSLIMNTLNDIYGEASDNYKETNKDVIAAEKANERLTDAMAEVGAIGEPIMTAIKEKVAEFAEVAVPKLQEFVDKMKDMKQWIQDNEDTINTWVGVIIGAGVSIGTFLLILNWGAIMTAAANAVNVVKTAIIGMNLAMKANPIGLVISLIAGLVAGFIYLWNTSDSFKKFWLDLWEVIKKSASIAWLKIKEAWNNAGAWFKEKFKIVQDAGKNAMDKVKQFFSDAYNKVKDTWSNIGTWFREKATSIKDGFTNAITSITQKASEIFQNVKDRISDKMNSIRSTVKGIIDKIKGFFDFSFKMPKIPVPSFGIKPKGWKVGDLLKGIKPSLSIKWNAEGGILTEPTVFGMAGDTLLGGGERGAEAIAPITTLQAYIDESVNKRNIELIKAFEMQVSRLISFIQDYFPAEYKIMLDTGILVGEMDSKMGERYKHNMRFNNL